MNGVVRQELIRSLIDYNYLPVLLDKGEFVQRKFDSQDYCNEIYKLQLAQIAIRRHRHQFQFMSLHAACCLRNSTKAATA